MVGRIGGVDKLPGLGSGLKTYSNTLFKFYNLKDLHKRLNAHHIHPITLKLKESGLVEVVGLLLVIYALELLHECISKYDPKTKKIMMLDNFVLLSFSQEVM